MNKSSKIPFFTGDRLCQSVDFLYSGLLCCNNNIHRIVKNTEELSEERRFFIPVSIVYQDNLSPEHFIGDHPQFENIYILDRLSSCSLNAIQSGRAILFIDYSGEGLQFSKSVLKSFHKELIRRGISSKNVVIVNENIKFYKFYKSWCLEESLEPVTILAYNHAMYQFSGTINANQSAERQLRLEAVLTQQAKRTHRDKLFVCLNNMPRTHRYALVTYLRSKGMDARGWLSCLIGTDADVADHMWEDVRALTSADPVTRHDFDSMMASIPLEADVDVTTQRAALAGALGGSNMYESAYFSFVTESELGDGQVVRVTEKVYKPIANMQPFLLFGAPSALEFLAAEGFVGQSPFIDETYDLLMDPVERFSALIEIVKKLNMLNHDQLINLTDSLLVNMRKNYDHLWDARDRYINDLIHFDMRQLIYRG
jgi:hypothetical protein